MSDPQTIAALGVVALTVVIFAYRLLSKKQGVCSGGCSCSVKVKSVLKPKR